MVGIAEYVTGGLIDRNRSGPGGGIGLGARVDHLGFKTP